MRFKVALVILTVVAMLSTIVHPAFSATTVPDNIKSAIQGVILLHIDSPDAFVKGTKTKIDSKGVIKPFIKNNRVMLPLRFIAENLGAKVIYDNMTGTITLEFGNCKVIMKANDSTMIVNDNKVQLYIPPEIFQGITMVPVRAVAEALGKKVSWNEKGLIAIGDENIFEGKDNNFIETLNKLFSETPENQPKPPVNPPKPPVRDLDALVKPSYVIATLKRDAPLYKYNNTRYRIGALKKGEKVEVIQDRSGVWYNVKSLSSSIVGWTYGVNLIIPPDPPTNKNLLTKDELERYVNIKGFTSETPYFVWVDISRQYTYVFMGTKGKWRLYKSIPCATGKNSSPTIRGTFKIGNRGKEMYFPQYKSKVKYWVSFYGSLYLFHSVLLDKNDRIIDPTLLKRASHGCIRLPLQESKWFYDYVKKGSTVFIY
ncbi:stalk domain-containing protein [Caldanaerobius polysaccharolyticus]|uniref:stalk domain-containing protein n=1 Tax=Caldanaerobius polysaccharolyticus TaxID=44256 RepID=UPI00068D9241|nr:stalk domain-containing protein [Caldanaerobius polysaccharolyticus]